MPTPVRGAITADVVEVADHRAVAPVVLDRKAVMVPMALPQVIATAAAVVEPAQTAPQDLAERASPLRLRETL